MLDMKGVRFLTVFNIFLDSFDPGVNVPQKVFIPGDNILLNPFMLLAKTVGRRAPLMILLG